MAKSAQAARVEMVLESLFESQREEWKDELPPDEFERRKHDFVFHMTDWSEDLERLSGWFRNPERYDDEAASTFLIGFLYHALPHLNAAGRLLLGRIADPFNESDGSAAPTG